MPSPHGRLSRAFGLAGPLRLRNNASLRTEGPPMTKLPLSASERAHRSEMRGLTTDAEGNETLQGLTAEESAELLNSYRNERPGSSANRDRRRLLQDRHEIARLSL